MDQPPVFFPGPGGLPRFNNKPFGTGHMAWSLRLFAPRSLTLFSPFFKFLISLDESCTAMVSFPLFHFTPPETRALPFIRAQWRWSGPPRTLLGPFAIDSWVAFPVSLFPLHGEKPKAGAFCEVLSDRCKKVCFLHSGAFRVSRLSLDKLFSTGSPSREHTGSCTSPLTAAATRSQHLGQVD